MLSILTSSVNIDAFGSVFIVLIDTDTLSPKALIFDYVFTVENSAKNLISALTALIASVCCSVGYAT